MSKKSPIHGKTPFQAARSIGAAERRARREARDATQQLSELDTRPGKSTKERRRLLKQLADSAR